MSEEGFKLAILWIAYFLYMLIGAFIFMSLEYKNEEQELRVLSEKLETLSAENSTATFGSLKTDKQRQFLYDFCSHGLALNPGGEHHYQWDLAGSFYFAGTVITTVGFGLTAPVTRAGKLFFLPYSLFGIPLHVLLFNTMLDRTVYLITGLLRRLHHKFSTGSPLSDWEPSTTLIALVAFLSMSILVLLSAPLFVFLEGWSYFESVYFAVVTYTTVGFGDFVPSSSPTDDNHNHTLHYKVGNWMVIIVGIMFMYPAIAIMATVYKHVLNGLYAKILACWKKSKSRNRTTDLGAPVQKPDAISGCSSTLSKKPSDFDRMFAQRVLKDWQNRCKASKMGTVNSVEASIRKSRVSLPRDWVAENELALTNSGPDSSNHVTGRVQVTFSHVNSLEELLAAESRITIEFRETLDRLHQQRQKLLHSSRDEFADIAEGAGSSTAVSQVKITAISVEPCKGDPPDGNTSS